MVILQLLAGLFPRLPRLAGLRPRPTMSPTPRLRFPVPPPRTLAGILSRRPPVVKANLDDRPCLNLVAAGLRLAGLRMRPSGRRSGGCGH